MSKIEIFKQDLTKDGQRVGLLTIIRGVFPKNTTEKAIKEIMQGFVGHYIGNKPYNIFVEDGIFCVCVIIEGMGNLNFEEYK